MAIDSVMLLICLCGVAGNGAVLCLLHRNSITLYIFDLAFADSLFLLLMVPSTLLYLLENMSCSTIMPLTYLRILFLLSLLPYNLGLYLMTAISIDRCTSILCPCWYDRHCPQRLLEVVNVLLWALSVGFTVTIASLCLCQEHERRQGAHITTYALNLILFASAMIISSTVLFVKVKCGPQQQQPRRLDIAILLTVLFLLLFALPLSLCNFLQQLGYIVVQFSQAVFQLTCITSSIKPFIYFLVWSCRRDGSMQSLRKALQSIFVEPKIPLPTSMLLLWTQQSEPVIPSPALLKDPGTVAELFLESPEPGALTSAALGGSLNAHGSWADPSRPFTG